MPETSQRSGSFLPSLFKEAGSIVRERGLVWLVVLLGSWAISLLLIPLDARILNVIRKPENESLNAAAQLLSEYGEIHYGILAYCILVALLGFLLRKVTWRRAAMTCAIGAIAAGLLVQIPRAGFGRARPDAEAAPGFHFMETAHDFNSFPSGHTTANFGGAVALAVAAPPVGIPLLGWASAVGWSRIQLNKHHLSDVLGGVAMGGVIGGILGLAARRVHRRRSPEVQEQRSPGAPS